MKIFGDSAHLVKQCNGSTRKLCKEGLPIVPVASLGVPVFENEEVLSIYVEAFIGNGKYILQYKLTDSFGKHDPRYIWLYALYNQGSTPLYNKLNFASQKAVNMSLMW